MELRGVLIKEKGLALVIVYCVVLQLPMLSFLGSIPIAQVAQSLPLQLGNKDIGMELVTGLYTFVELEMASLCIGPLNAEWIWVCEIPMVMTTGNCGIVQGSGGTYKAQDPFNLALKGSQCKKLPYQCFTKEVLYPVSCILYPACDKWRHSIYKV